MNIEKQSHDSIMEVLSNVAVGFFVSWAVLEFIVAPLYGYHTSAGEGFAITMIFTVTSVMRSYVLRRVFNGRSPWAVLRSAFS